MSIQDFLITFKADTTGALSNINALATRVREVDAALNTAMGSLNRAAAGGRTGGPLSALASGAPAASVGVNRINNELLGMGRNLKLTEKDVQALLVRLTQLKTAFAIGTNAGEGPKIQQGRVTEAITVIEQLRSGQAISAKQATKWADEISASYAKVARIPPELRNLPILEQNRVQALRAREATQGSTLNQLSQPLGGQRNLRSQQTALENYIRTVRQLGEFSLVSAGQLDKLESELLQVRAASSLSSQRGSNDRTVGNLQEQAGVLRNRISRVPFGSDAKAELTDMRALQRTLQEMADRGQPVQRELSQVTQKVQQLSAAASIASQRLREMRAAESVQSKADTHRLRAQQPFTDSGAQLKNLQGLERALATLQARGNPVQKELDETRRKIEQLAQAATRAKSIADLLGRRTVLEGRLSRVRNDSSGSDRNLIRDLKGVEEALEFKGAGNATKLQSIRQQFAAMPPVLSNATRGMLEFNRALQQRVAMGERLNLPVQSPATLMKGLSNGMELMRQGFDEGGKSVDFFSQRVAALPPTLSRAAQGMLSHSRRVAEGLFIYEAFGRAMQAVGAQIELVNTLAREQIRFSAVAGGVGEGGNSGFLLGLQDIATRTNTPMDELAAQLDTVAAGMIEAGDATTIHANAQKFLNDVGQFTNITQRDLATETNNLLGIYNQSGDSVGQFSDRLGRIVVAGRNSSKIISSITDVISEAGRSARTTGFDFDFLASLAGQMTTALLGSMSGSEIGGLLNTVIGRLTDPEVINKIRDLSDGIIQFSNADGSLRGTSDILIDIFKAIDSGVISAAAAPKILDQIVPPLNPGARSFVKTLQEQIPQALLDMDRIVQGNAETAKEFSEALVSGPGEQFATAMKDLKGALTGIFSNEIIEAGNKFADIIRGIAGLLGSGEAGGGIAGGIASVIAKLILFGAALKIASFAFGNLRTIMLSSSARTAAIGDMLVGIGTKAGTSGTAVGNMAGQLTLWGTQGRIAGAGTDIAARAMTGLGTAMSGVLGFARALLPVLLLMAAIELPDTIGGIGALAESEEDILKRTRVDPQALRSAMVVAPLPGAVRGIGSGLIGTMQNLFAEDLTGNQFDNLIALSQAMIRLQKEGKLTAATQKLLEDQVLGTNDKVKEQTITTEELLANMSVLTIETDKGAGAWNGYSEATGGVADGLNEIATAEERASAALQINAGLSDARASALNRLTDQLRAGAITVDEWAEGQANVGSASESAAAFVAAYGDQLALIPGLQERMAKTGQAAADALMSILLDNPDTIGERIGILDTMVQIADANSDLAAELEENPIEISVSTQKLIDGLQKAETIFTLGYAGMRDYVNRRPIEPQIALEKLKSQALAALNIYKVMLAASSLFNRATASSTSSASLKNLGDSALRARVAGTSAIGTGFSTSARFAGASVTELDKAIAELTAAGTSLGTAGKELTSLGGSFNTLGGISGGDPRLGAASAAAKAAAEIPQPNILDIGDFDAAKLSDAIALAFRLQSSIPGATAAAKDDMLSIIKDAEFLRQINSLDDELLRKAIERLTDIEEARLALEKQKGPLLFNQVVNQGSLSSLITQPGSFGTAGAFIGGSGLNGDPNTRGLTINIGSISGQSLTASQISELMYAAFSRALSESARL